MKGNRKQRTGKQNNSAHLYFELLAKALNDAGYSVRDIVLGGQTKLLLKLYYACVKYAMHISVISAIIKQINIKKLKVETPWTKGLVKELIWRPVQKAMTGEESTTQMNTVDPSEIHAVVNEHIGKLTEGNINVPWPSEENRNE